MRLNWTLLFLLWFGFLAPGVQAAPAHVDSVHGDVQKRAVGMLRWEDVTPGEKIEEGAVLKTGPDSDVEILTEQGHRFNVHSETTIEFASLQADETQVRLNSGRVLSKVQKLKARQRFSVQTPTAVCAVRGTEFDTVAGEGGTLVSVYHGVVGVAALGSHDEIRVPAGQMTSVHHGTIEIPRPIPKESRAPAGDSALAHAARHEVGLDMTRNQVIAAAAMEMRLADYREGKSLVDVNGHRVRVDEYIVRPRSDQFKLVVLDKRDARLDYFFYQGTFNQTLPADLSVALKDLSGKVGTSAPDYYLTAYEMGQSNTRDSIHDTAAGGHLVKISQDGQGNYILTDPTDPSNTRTIQAVVQQVDDKGNITYKVYNPLSDSFFTATAAQLAASTKFGVYIPENDTFKDLAPGDTLWKTRFNTYEHAINSVMKQSYSKAAGISNILTLGQDANQTFAGGYASDPVVVPDPNNIDATATNYYGDGTLESYRTVLIDDAGIDRPPERIRRDLDRRRL